MPGYYCSLALPLSHKSLWQNNHHAHPDGRERQGIHFTGSPESSAHRLEIRSFGPCRLAPSGHVSSLRCDAEESLGTAGGVMRSTGIQRRTVGARVLAVVLAAALVPVVAVVPQATAAVADLPTTRAATQWGPWHGSMSIASVETIARANSTTTRTGKGTYSNLAAAGAYSPGGDNTYRADVTVEMSDKVTVPCEDGGGAATDTSSWMYSGSSEGAVDSADGGAGYIGGYVVRLEDREADQVYLTPEFVQFNTTDRYQPCPPFSSQELTAGNDTLSFYVGFGGQAIDPLIDTDPDPAHLVGTTSWGLANFPTTSPPYTYTAYEFTVTYDLRREPVGQCPKSVTLSGEWLPGTGNQFARDVRWTAKLDGAGWPVRVVFGRSGGPQKAVTGSGAVHSATLTYGGPPGWQRGAVAVTVPGHPECGSIGADSPDRVLVDPVDFYAPTVRFHPKEKLFAGDPGKFISESKLRFEGTYAVPRKGSPGRLAAECTPTLMESKPQASRLGTAAGKRAYTVAHPARTPLGLPCIFGPVNQAPSKVQITSKRPYGYVLDHSNSTKARRGSTTAPMYAEFHGGSTPYIVYWLFYPHNDWKYGPLREIHEGDWERVAVHLRGSDLAAVKVDYFQHYCTPDTRAFSGLEMDAGSGTTLDAEAGHFMVFTALGGHASYPQSDSHGQDMHNSCITERKGFIDYTGRGKTWQAWKEPIRNAMTQPWYGFGGAWGMRSNKSRGPGADNWGPAGPGPHRGELKP